MSGWKRIVKRNTGLSSYGSAFSLSVFFILAISLSDLRAFAERFNAAISMTSGARTVAGTQMVRPMRVDIPAAISLSKPVVPQYIAAITAGPNAKTISSVRRR